MNHSAKRFEALDSWRGICACLIVFHHMSFGHLQSFFLVQNAHTAVDFFFVLSGFVIAYSYQEKIIKGFSLRDFIFLRVGRIYPLHMLMLFFFVLLELSKLLVPAGEAMFTNESKNIETFINNVLLIQGLGMFDVLSWNGPSWSISAEFYTYLFYGMALFVFRQKLWIPALLTMIAAPVALIVSGHTVMDMTYNGGFFRCVYGFSGGVLCYYLMKFLPKDLSGLKFPHALETASLTLILLFIAFASNNLFSYLTPYVFMFAVLVFSYEAGCISKFLKQRAFLFIGMLSYSIYMTHSFLQFCFSKALLLFESKTGVNLFDTVLVHGYAQPSFLYGPWWGNALDLALFAVVLVFSYGTYRLVEKPANTWFRDYAQLGPPILSKDKAAAF